MSGNVEDLVERQEHLVVLADDGAHVVSVALIRRVASGAMPVSALGDSVVRQALSEWLAYVCSEQ